MTARARRLAEAPRWAVVDHLAKEVPPEPLMAEGVVIPRAGSAVLDVDGRAIAVTNLERALWPEAGFTKADLIAYLLRIAGAMLPHLRDRPLTLGRFPGGVEGRGFAQAEMPGLPDWMRTTPLALRNRVVRRFTRVDERAGLVWLAQHGVLELHAFPGRGDDTSRPGVVVFDLDPDPPSTVLTCADVALRLRDLLEAQGRTAAVKTSGSLGLHVVTPVCGETDYAETRAFATSVARSLAAAHPDRVTLAMARAARDGRVLVDVRQNAERLTTVVPYSTRSTPRPTVSTPVGWDELGAALSRGDEGALRFEPDQVVQRVAVRGDLFASMRP